MMEQKEHDAIQGVLDLLSKHYESVVRSASAKEVQKWARGRMTAYDKAALQVSKMTDAVLAVGGRILVPSRTHADRVYRATSVGCNCEAGTAGAFCWHSALADALEALAEQRAGKEITFADPIEVADPFADLEEEDLPDLDADTTAEEEVGAVRPSPGYTSGEFGDLTPPDPGADTADVGSTTMEPSWGDLVARNPDPIPEPARTYARADYVAGLPPAPEGEATDDYYLRLADAYDSFAGPEA